MRCPIFRRTVWTKRGGIFRPCFNSCFVIYIVYFVVVLFGGSRAVVLITSEVCHVENATKCICINNNTAAVQCLTQGLSHVSPCSKEARKSYRLFCEVLSQYDCRNTRYSVKWNCSDCLEAYTNWLVAVFSPNEAWLANCTNQPSQSVYEFCKKVLARCPYFSPQDSYGDLPAFECSIYGKVNQDKSSCDL